MFNPHPEETAYSAARRIPPAHSFVIRAGEVRIQRYWRLSANISPLDDLPYDTIVARFRETFLEAVKCRLRSNGPVGSHLSGGLDSSSVTCAAAQLLEVSGDEPPIAISNIFETVTACDESRWISRVLDGLDLRHEVVRADRRGPLAALSPVSSFIDEVYVGSNHQLVLGLDEAANSAGLRVCLDGLDGDTVVSHGFERLHELANLRDWSEFGVQVNALSTLHDTEVRSFVRMYAIPHLDEWTRGAKVRWLTRAIRELHRHLGISRWWLVRRASLVAASSLKRALQRRPATRTSDRQLSQLPRPELRPGLQQQLDERHPATSVQCSAREMHVAKLESPSLSSTFESMDLYAAHHAMEARHPFFDKRLVELCASLPASAKLDNGWGRRVLRDAMDGLVPDEVRWRADKTNMHPCFVHGLLVLDKELLEETITDGLDLLIPYADLAFIRSLYEQVVQKPTEEVSTPEITTLWRAVAMARLLASRSSTSSHA